MPLKLIVFLKLTTSQLILGSYENPTRAAYNRTGIHSRKGLPMFLAAFKSLSKCNPQLGAKQTNIFPVLFPSVPHHEQVLELLYGLTITTWIPYLLAICVECSIILLKNQCTCQVARKYPTSLLEAFFDQRKSSNLLVSTFLDLSPIVDFFSQGNRVQVGGIEANYYNIWWISQKKYNEMMGH